MRYFCIFCLCLCSMAVHAKKKKDKGILDKASFCCVYRHFVNTVDLDDISVVDSTEAILEVGETVSKYGDFSAYSGETPESFSPAYPKNDPRSYDGFSVYQGYPDTKKLTVREGLLPNFYVYEEENKLQWEMLSGKEKVLGHKCQKAKAVYGGRTWTVSYSTEIPSASGPWKLNGLPGLILKAESEDGVHRFVAVALFNVKDQDIVFDTEEEGEAGKDVAVSRKKFIELRNQIKTNPKWAKRPMYYLTKTDYRSIFVIPKNNDHGLTPRRIVNGITLPVDGWGFGHRFQPLELK